ncbi:TlpA family protein disulfide reductase [Phyllobacterium sp. 21LDTY02-6]|jgi:thiol-disulfide isomerase/thioredoxin|uniref:thiol:disulfide interchange protein TlpA n=1 Tax=unclassified Phyllobacterium TaxID=2638441 RepID=UPI002021BB00|nr:MULTISPECIES: TlpA disulfide reductase family protein [unclassified Phyllobacterium]MCO4317768.1 TlpA family protein disulfide reductase [Phyllobacterium sp. 21LDTY02-6]MCX8281559.1 TlpA disulfide reductase family protein [Phyllobacterium sp. 0TCS1.6C]MCX8292845.1 TlpA disulfide reductase family protein [Phyllobacterium sp. 0TCS1.6A]
MIDGDGTPKQTRNSSKKIIALAALAGIAAGALGVYVMERPSGNIVAGVASTDQCSLKTEAAKSLDGLATGAVAAMRGADTPQSMASLSFMAPDGKPARLSDFKGKTLLVNLWATWCAPCREEMPALDALAAKKNGADFEVVTINIDTGDAEKPQAFMTEIGVKSLPLYRDATMGVFNDLKRKNLAFGLPVTMLVDKDGCQVAAMNGPADWSGEDAVRLIDAAKKL